LAPQAGCQTIAVISTATGRRNLGEKAARTQETVLAAIQFLIARFFDKCGLFEEAVFQIHIIQKAIVPNLRKALQPFSVLGAVAGGKASCRFVFWQAGEI
jgi:hypothetical protein